MSTVWEHFLGNRLKESLSCSNNRGNRFVLSHWCLWLEYLPFYAISYGFWAKLSSFGAFSVKKYTGFVRSWANCSTFKQFGAFSVQNLQYSSIWAFYTGNFKKYFNIWQKSFIFCVKLRHLTTYTGNFNYLQKSVIFGANIRQKSGIFCAILQGLQPNTDKWHLSKYSTEKWHFLCNSTGTSTEHR